MLFSSPFLVKVKQAKVTEKSKTAVQNHDDKMGRSFISRFMFTKLRTPDCYITM